MMEEWNASVNERDLFAYGLPRSSHDTHRDGEIHADSLKSDSFVGCRVARKELLATAAEVSLSRLVGT